MSQLSISAEKDAVYGSAYGFFGGGQAGAEACRAIGIRY
jgi:hypothetical protein